MRARLRLIALMLICALSLSGCMFSSRELNAPEEIPLPEPSPEPQNMILGEQLPNQSANVTLYFAASDGAGFTTVTRSVRTESGESLPEAVVDALLSSRVRDSAFYPSGDTRLLSCEYACGLATVNLSLDARNVQSAQELLALETSIGNTLLSLPNVRGVNVLIGSQSEGYSQMPSGVQTEIISSVTASYAQVQAEREHLSSGDSSSITRKAALYFPTENGGWLVPELREVTFDTADFINPLINALKAGPKDESTAIASIPEGVELMDEKPAVVTLPSGQHVLSLNFSSTLANYLAFSGLDLWELLGSLTLTLCSFLPEVDAIRVMVNGEPITICEIGDAIVSFPNGLIRRNSFSSHIGSVATLYLVNDENALTAVTRPVSMRSAYSPKSLLTELFYYAGGDASQPRFPAPASVYSEDLLGVQVSEGVAKVNLSASFYRSCQTLGAEDERNLVYSMVNTLCNMDGIRGVRFYVEGLSAETLAGSIYLQSVLLPNPGIVAHPSEDASEELNETIVGG